MTKSSEIKQNKISQMNNSIFLYFKPSLVLWCNAVREYEYVELYTV